MRCLLVEDHHLLDYPAYRAGKPVSGTEIREHVYEDQTGGSGNAVDACIGYIRKKLNADGKPEIIHTRRGVGSLMEYPST